MTSIIEILNHDCLLEILKYLPVRDLLNLSLVSRNFNERVNLSKKNLDRIWLRFYEPLGDVKYLLSSTREYSSFKVQHRMPAKMNLVFNKFEWKHVMLRDQEWKSYKEYVEFIKEIALTVESLDLWDIEIKEEVVDFIKVDFPKLKKLEMNLTNRAAFSIFLGVNPMLREVKINDSSFKFPHAQDQLIEPTNMIHELIKANRIEKLTLLYCMWAFEHDLTEDYTNTAYLDTLTVTFDSALHVPDTQIHHTRKLIRMKRARVVKSEKAGASGKHLTISYLN